MIERNHVLIAIIVELLIFAIGAYLYLKVTKAANKKGSITIWSLLAFLILVYFMNVFGDPPPSEGPIGYVGLSMWLLVAWGYWIDRNRKPV